MSSAAGTLIGMTASPCDITLFVPGLLGPQPVYAKLPGTDKPDLQLLEFWLSRAEKIGVPIRDSLAGIFSLFNLASDGDATFPVAAVTAAYDDLFTTKDFYQDSKYWVDPRYTRCNSPRRIDDMWVDNFVGEWGNCKDGLSLKELESPYPYKTARPK